MSFQKFKKKIKRWMYCRWAHHRSLSASYLNRWPRVLIPRGVRRFRKEDTSRLEMWSGTHCLRFRGRAATLAYVTKSVKRIITLSSDSFVTAPSDGGGTLRREPHGSSLKRGSWAARPRDCATSPDFPQLLIRRCSICSICLI